MNIRNKVLNFYRSFNCNPVILYVGQNISDADLKEYIADLPWSCVITSRREPEFCSIFASETRRTKECNKKEDIPTKPINKQLLSVLRLYTDNDDESDEGDELQSLLMFDDSYKKKLINEKANEMFRVVQTLLDGASQLIVVGYDPENENEFPLTDFCVSLAGKRIPFGCVHLWGIDEKYTQDGPLKRLSELKEFELNTESLSAAIKENKTDAGADVTLPDYSVVQDDVFFSAGNPVSISQDELVRFRHLAMLMTDRTINSIRPIGKIMYEKWFFNFLNLSSTEGPQWYGYLPSSKFYVRRNFEDPLVALVRKMLDGSIAQEDRAPVILEGPSGSSKSITLAALAYRIFNEHLCPVIFIKNESFMFYNDSEELNRLEELMRLIDEKTEKKGRILLVWDCSSYRSVEKNALRLMRQLQNRGRRFVLVCSAYGKSNDFFTEDDSIRYIKTDEPGKVYFDCQEEEKQIEKRGLCYYVEAKRDMDDREIYELWSKIKEYSGLDSHTVKFWRERFKERGETDIFQYFYKLIALIRPNLESGLSREEQKIWQYVEEQIKEILESPQMERQPTAMELALMEAGIDISELGEPAADEGSGDNYIDMESFCLCIAMFSKFKLDVPYNIAYEILTGSSDTGDIYTPAKRKLFNIITKIPLVYYGECDAEGDYAFRFRNAFEAQLFLERKDPSGDKQLGLISRIIKMYGNDYKRNGYEDERFKKNLLDFLRLIGPNSEYYKNADYEFEQSHVKILKNLDSLIKELEALDVPDENAGFAKTIITFVREFNGKIWDNCDAKRIADENNIKLWEADRDRYNPETYKHRISELVKVRATADKSKELLERQIRENLYTTNKQNQADQCNSLKVETAFINLLIERLEREYKECCTDFGVEIEAQYSNIHTEYLETFRELKSVIYFDSLNGYAYNALFSSFEHMYEKEKLSEEKKLQYLSEIMPITDMAQNPDITNRGDKKDELSQHVQKILDFGNNYAITIDEVNKRRNGEATNESLDVYFKLYDELMEANNPAAITFVCQKELNAADIKAKTKLTERQRAVCEKVCAFMKQKDNYECIVTDANALALLIRVMWMCYNGYPLSGNADRQKTYLDRSQWIDINRLCRIYSDRARNIGYQPVIILIYAVSVIQLNNDYREAMQILHSVDENRFSNVSRTKTPYMICESDGSGNTKKHEGKVINIRDRRTGHIQIFGIPEQLGGTKRGIHFDYQNIGLDYMPERGESLTGLEIGLGYIGPTTYTEKGRKEREGRI